MENLSAFLPPLLTGARITVLVTVLAAGFGLVLAVAAGLGRLASNRFINWLASTYVEVFRGTSAVVQMFWIFFVLPFFGVELAPITAGWVALGLNIGSYGAEVVRGAIQSVPRGQWEASVALSFSARQRMRRIIFPQALVLMLPPFGNLLIELLKGTALVSTITVSDLTFEAQKLRANTGQSAEIFTLALIIYFVMAYLITLGMRRVERRYGIGLDVRRKSALKAG